MGMDELKNLIYITINDYDENREFSNELKELYLQILHGLTNNHTSYKDSVMNLFLRNIFQSFETCLLLIDMKKYKDAYVIGRKIVEILIREYYVSDKELYELYYRLKYKEKAEVFRNLLIGNDIKIFSKTHWWKERNNILKDNIEFYEWVKKEEVKELPKIEIMAKESDLTYLYQVRYRAWSKYVHCNMILEMDMTNETDFNFQFLRDINTCMLEFIKKYSDKLNVFKEEIIKFKQENPIITSFNLTTGNRNSNVDITIELINNLFHEDIEKEDDDTQYEKEHFNKNNTDYQRKQKTLKALIKEKELELENIKNKL